MEPERPLIARLIGAALRERRLELGLSERELEERIFGPGNDMGQLTNWMETVFMSTGPLMKWIDAYSIALNTEAPALLSRAGRIGFESSPGDTEFGEWTVADVRAHSASRIKLFRKELGWSQAELANRMRDVAVAIDPEAGYDRTSARTISGWETERQTPSMAKILIMAAAFKVSPLEFCVPDPDRNSIQRF